jgi:GNAT superfamily N-acetyltransferase
MKTIAFKSATEFERGILYKLLCESYAALLESKPRFADEYRASWAKADNDTFSHPDTIGRCVLISTFNNVPVGFFSWDPRKIPAEGEVGQNCIVPSHRGKGYGKLQILKVLEVFQAMKTRTVKVTTDNHPFFLPARKTYLSCGFKEVGRSHANSLGGLELIHYEYKS